MGKLFECFAAVLVTKIVGGGRDCASMFLFSFVCVFSRTVLGDLSYPLHVL